MKKMKKNDLKKIGVKILIGDFYVDHFGESGLEFSTINFFNENDRVLKLVDLHYENKGEPSTQIFEMSYDYFLNNEFKKYDFEDSEEIKKIKKRSKKKRGLVL